MARGWHWCDGHVTDLGPRYNGATTYWEIQEIQERLSSENSEGSRER